MEVIQKVIHLTQRVNRKMTMRNLSEIDLSIMAGFKGIKVLTRMGQNGLESKRACQTFLSHSAKSLPFVGLHR